jgi:hypothetical protein
MDDFERLVLSRLPQEIIGGVVAQDSRSPSTRVPLREKPWGTGHALLCAEPLLSGPFAIVNADDYYGKNSFRSVRAFLGSCAPANPAFCMAGYRLDKTMSAHGSVSRAICAVDGSMRLASLTERKSIAYDSNRIVVRDDDAVDLKGDALVSMNLFGFSPAVFDLARKDFASFLSAEGNSKTAEFGLPNLVDRAVRSGNASVRVLPTDDVWFGLTYREDIEDARARIRILEDRGAYPSPLWRQWTRRNVSDA